MLASLIATLAHWCAPWQKLYSDSKVLETAVTAVHIVATLVGGGIALAADRTTLRILRGRTERDAATLRELRATHRPVLIGLAVLFVSGVALAAADVETFAKSPIFLAKLILVVLLCANGLFLTQTESRLRDAMLVRASEPSTAPALWTRLATASWLSIALWVTTTVVGTALLNA